MKNYEYILFDLDGTLTDPGLGITNSIIYALKRYNIEVSDRSELYKFIGPPLIDSFMNSYGFTFEKAREAVGFYREYFKDFGIFENTPYEGIESLLNSLKEQGKKLIIATSKPEIFAKQIVEHFDLAKYFDYVAGSNMDDTRTKKDEVIAYALESCQIHDLSKVVMIGDREHDVIGAKKVSVDSIGVLYGYGDREEHEKAGADYIVESVKELRDLLLM